MVRFTQRHRIATFASLAIFGSLLLGIMFASAGLRAARLATRKATQEWQRAEQQRSLAEQEAAKAVQVLHLLESMIGASHPDQGHPADYRLRDQLDDFANSFANALSNQPEVAAQIHGTLGRAYWSLGDMTRAGTHLERSLELFRQLHGDIHALTARAQVDLALYFLRTSRYRDAWLAWKVAMPVLLNEPPSQNVVWGHFVESKLYHALDRHTEAKAAQERAVACAELVCGPSDPLTILMRARWAGAQSIDNDSAAALELAQNALTDIRRVLPEQHVDVADIKRICARSELRAHNIAAAKTLILEAIDIHRQLLGQENSRVALDLLTLSRIHRAEQDYEGSARLAREASDMCSRVSMDRETIRFQAASTLATALEPIDANAAADAWQDAIDCRTEAVGRNVQIAQLLTRRARMLIELTQLDEAVSCYAEAIEIVAQDQGGLLPELVPKKKNHAAFFNVALEYLELLTNEKRLDHASQLVERIQTRAAAADTPLAFEVANVAHAQLALVRGDLNSAASWLSNHDATALRGTLAIRAQMVQAKLRAKQGRRTAALRILRRAHRNVSQMQSEDMLARSVARLADKIRQHSKRTVPNDRARLDPSE